MAIKVDSTYADAYYGRGVCFYYLNDQDKALADYSKALIYLQRPELFYIRGLIYSNKKMWKEAISDYSNAISTTTGTAVNMATKVNFNGTIDGTLLAFDFFKKSFI